MSSAQEGRIAIGSRRVHERPDSRDVLSRLRAIAASRGDRVERAREAAEQIRLGGNYHWVGLYDVTDSEICVIASTGTAPPAYPRFPKTQGLNGAAVSSGRPVTVNDVRNDPRYLTTFGTTRAEAIVPIGVRNAIVGTIDVESDRVDAFAKEDERFLQQCAAALWPLWSPAGTASNASDFMFHVLMAGIASMVGAFVGGVIGMDGSVALFGPVVICAALAGAYMSGRSKSVPSAWVWLPAGLWFAGWTASVAAEGTDYFVSRFIGRDGWCGDLACAPQYFVTSPLIGTAAYVAAARAEIRSRFKTNGLRLARASDIPAMQRIRASVRENRLVSTVISDEDVRTAIEDTGYGWVIEEDGTVVAFAVGNVRTGNVWALFVHPDHERRGHGRRLHDAMVDRLFELGLDRLWLTTEPGTRAQRFYEAAGWRQTGTSEQGELEYELRRT